MVTAWLLLVMKAKPCVVWMDASEIEFPSGSVSFTSTGRLEEMVFMRFLKKSGALGCGRGVVNGVGQLCIDGDVLVCDGVEDGVFPLGLLLCVEDKALLVS